MEAMPPETTPSETAPSETAPPNAAVADAAAAEVAVAEVLKRCVCPSVRQSVTSCFSAYLQGCFKMLPYIWEQGLIQGYKSLLAG